MKKTIFFLVLLFDFASCRINAQNHATESCKKELDTVMNRTVYTQTDMMPIFQNGGDALLKYFSSHYRITNEDDFQGSFKFIFIIDTDGSVIGARIKDKRSEQISNAEREGLKIIEHMPKWKAGKCNGKKVSVRVILPISL